MPIRFRCAFCNQLMGIARRKAGTVVRCPKCQGQVIVPDPEPAVSPAAAAAGPPGPQAIIAPKSGPGKAPPGKGPVLFEQSDFGNLLAPNPPPRSAPLPASDPSSGFDVEPLGNPELLGPGVFLSANKLTIISVAIVFLLGLAFFMGLLVGRS